MLEGIKRIFGRAAERSCVACEVKEGYIQVLKDQVAFQQAQITRLEDALFRALRIDDRTANNKQQNPVQTMPMPWVNWKKKLEDKYSGQKDKPEDKVEEHWKTKIEELEEQAGFITQHPYKKP